MTFIFIGPLSLLFPPQHDAHVKDWRWEMFLRGIHVDKQGRHFDARGVRIK